MARQSTITENNPPHFSKVKIVFGIIIPLILILSLAIISVYNTGLNVKINYIDIINKSNYNNLDLQNMKNIQIVLENITVKNDKIIPQRYSLPRLGACISSSEGLVGPLNINLVYSAGEYNQMVGRYEFDQAFFDISSYPYEESRTLEMPINSEKAVQISLDLPIYTYTDYQTNQPSITIAGSNEIWKYDTLKIYEIKDKEYWNNCYSITAQQESRAKVIPLVW